MQPRTRSAMSMIVVLIALSAGLSLMLACSWSVTVSPDESERTLEALAEENEEQASQISDQATWIESERTLEALAEENEEQASQISDQATWIAHLATRVGAPIATAYWIMGPTPTPYWTTPTPPVSGYVEIEEGQCCIGGSAGSTVEVRVGFWAYSPFAEVTQMRVLSGGQWFDEAQLADASWEPYVEGRIYPVTIALNWTGFYVTVQYRDSFGNLSPVYFDDISVEGMPVEEMPLTPTPYPTPYG